MRPASKSQSSHTHLTKLTTHNSQVSAHSSPWITLYGDHARWQRHGRVPRQQQREVQEPVRRCCRWRGQRGRCGRQQPPHPQGCARRQCDHNRWQRHGRVSSLVANMERVLSPGALSDVTPVVGGARTGAHRHIAGFRCEPLGRQFAHGFANLASMEVKDRRRRSARSCATCTPTCSTWRTRSSLRCCGWRIGTR